MKKKVLVFISKFTEIKGVIYNLWQNKNNVDASEKI